MTPVELSNRHPQLFHVTLPGAWESIRARGLLSTSRLLDLFEVYGGERLELERVCRPSAVTIRHPVHGCAVINDQSPMTESALAGCLDGGLTPAHWLALLNRRVFFWSDEKGLARLVGARANRARAIDILVVDTLGLARAHAERIELSPINSGATIRKPARRGPATFTPLLELSYVQWRRKRGRNDRIIEVTVLDGVPDIANYVTEIRRMEPHAKGTETHRVYPRVDEPSVPKSR